MTRPAPRSGHWPPVCSWPSCNEARNAGRGRRDLCARHAIVADEQRQRRDADERKAGR